MPLSQLNSKFQHQIQSFKSLFSSLSSASQNCHPCQRNIGRFNRLSRKMKACLESGRVIIITTPTSCSSQNNDRNRLIHHILDTLKIDIKVFLYFLNMGITLFFVHPCTWEVHIYIFIPSYLYFLLGILCLLMCITRTPNLIK